MKTAIEILKNIVLPQFKKDKGYNYSKDSIEFWIQFTRFFVDFEKDAKPVYAKIYGLELADSEKIIAKLPQYYTDFLKELAESYVVGILSEASDYLISTNNQNFLEQVQFYKTLQNVVKKAERKRIKEELPKSYERLTFELSETDIANVTKKKGREDLREKLKQWDSELEEQEAVPVISMLTNEKDKTKVISLNWMRYVSIVAIFIIGFMIWQPNKLSNDKLFSQYSSEESIIKSIDYQKMTTVSESGETRGGEILFQNYTKSETDMAMEAIELFKNKNFEKSKQILISLNPKEKNNQLLLFLAITQLKTNEINEAVSNLEYLNTISNYEFSDEVKFNLGLGYINQNENRKAKDLLVALVSANNKYSNTAQEILDNMRWF